MNLEVIKQTFPNNTQLIVTTRGGKDIYNLSFKHPELIETPFGGVPKLSFSASNYDFDIAVYTLKQTLESNGYNFETKIWQ